MANPGGHSSFGHGMCAQPPSAPSLFCGLFSPGQPEIQVHWNCRPMQKRWAVPPRNAMASSLGTVATILQVEA